MTDAPLAPVDLRSDTVTRPTPTMRRAMAEAEVGDDGYGEDPTVNALEERVAARLGREAAMYVPSGTMANQVALRLLGRPGTLVVAGRRQHVIAHEAGAAGVNASAQLHAVDDPGGIPSHEELAWLIEARDHHWPEVSAVFAENTHLMAGGAPWGAADLERLAAPGLPVHLDGARLFHAEVALGVPASELSAAATTVSCCLSKGLGAPVGSLLAGSAELIDRARFERKRLGGSMRQAGIVAAAGLVALDQHVERLADDHRRAAQLAEAVAERWPGAIDPADVRTNIVLFGHPDAAALLAHLDAAGVRAGTVGPGLVRFVTHLDVDDDGLARALDAVRTAP
ncbi:MAG TPA: threonine aldolase family protein [Acidimicrobiales bacterium]